MWTSPQQRLAALRETCLWGWRRVRTDEGVRQTVEQWLAAHPSNDPRLDEAWREALKDRGALAAWLDAAAELEDWPLDEPAHSVLASHPFAAVPPWSIPLTSRRS